MSPASPPSIRPERPGDEAAVREVNEQAFGQPDEARIVDRVRPLADRFISLVAVEDDRVIGHVLFTPVTVRHDTDAWHAFALGPVAVMPSRQRRGVGAALIRAGLEACLDIDEPVVFVLGDPKYYARFGFRSAAALGLRFRSAEFDEAFMVVELRPGALGERRGMVEYLAPFDDG